MKLLIASTVALTLRSFLLPFAAHFRRRGWKVDGLANGAASCAACGGAFDEVFDVAWTRSPADVVAIWRAAARLRDVVERGQYDLVHVHTPIAAFLMRWALRNRRQTAVIYTAHGFHFHSGGRWATNTAFSALEKLAGRWTDELVVMNDEDEDAARDLRLLPDERIHRALGIGIDLDQYRPDLVPDDAVARFRRDAGLADPDVLFSIVAELTPRKHHVDALAALAQVSDRRVHLAFAGEGPLREILERRAAELGVAERVKFLGVRRDVPVVMRASRATILPSVREGLPRCVLESMALAVPVIGAEIRGTRELVRTDRGGFPFPAGDAKLMAEHIRALAASPEGAARAGQRARASLEPYALPRIIEFHERLYELALARAGFGASPARSLTA